MTTMPKVMSHELVASRGGKVVHVSIRSHPNTLCGREYEEDTDLLTQWSNPALLCASCSRTFALAMLA